MPRRYALLAAFALLAVAARAQTGAQRFGFEFGAVAKVVQGAANDTLAHAWAGGLNTPQFSAIDLNGDGQDDLFAFDRQTTRCYTFLNLPAAGGGSGRRWAYAPEYESLFPADLQNWALLRDYDCDGRPDIFTAATSGNGDIRVLRNAAGAGGRPSFQLATPQIRFAIPGVSGTSNLTVGTNLPAIQDVNGDGKLDLLTYDWAASLTLELYLNTSPGPCGAALAFTQATGTWGGISACSSCTGYQGGGLSCRGLAPQHTPSHNVLLVDLNGDGALDLLDSRDIAGCDQLVSLVNRGNSVQAAFDATSLNANFPVAANPARVAGFPTGYYFDATLDGRPDLVVAPNLTDNRSDRVSLRNSVRLYENTAASGPPAFAYRPDGFLQNQMLDASEQAAPAFGDLSGDGLPDLLLGSTDLVNGSYRASLYYYQNVGTRRRPVFRLVSADYLGLGLAAATSATPRQFESIRPALVDLNRDGALDLVYSVYDRGSNRLYFVLNAAAAGQPAVFDPATADYFKPRGAAGSGNLPYMQGDAPCFYDVDNDGNVDLLVGTNESREPGFSLRYFRNTGTGPLDQRFVLANNDYGQVRVPTSAYNPTGRPINLAPTVADFDGDGTADLVTADATGTLRLFANFRSQAVNFLERTDVVFNSLSNQYEASRLGVGLFVRQVPAAADLDGDGAPELYVGTETGGVLSLLPRNRGGLAAQSPAARALALAAYPNPADRAAGATVETASPTRLALLDLTGRVVRRDEQPSRRRQLPTAGLAPGLYLLQATAADGTVATARLQVE